jgi:predicted nucleic acid-binding protein
MSVYQLTIPYTDDLLLSLKSDREHSEVEARLLLAVKLSIISLALVQQLDLLRKLYGEVWIPPAVASELRTGGIRTGAAEVRTADYIRTVTLDDPRRTDLLSDLDRFEPN